MSFEKYKSYTQARIGLGNKGAGLPTKEWLEFSYAHAAAVDAVRVVWDVEKARKEIAKLGVAVQVLSSRIHGREDYLLRPDLGRALDDASVAKLGKLGTANPSELLLLVTNGLSTFALDNHLVSFLKDFLPKLKAAGFFLAHNSIFLVPDARVGIMDALGEIMKPELGLVVVGERPGLTSPDSMGIYFSYKPRMGQTDANRNCISNIRPPHGLSYEVASFKAQYLIQNALRLKLSGVDLKDESGHLVP